MDEFIADEKGRRLRKPQTQLGICIFKVNEYLKTSTNDNCADLVKIT